MQRNLVVLLALVIIAALMQTCVMRQAAVPAMDCVGFVAVAQSIDRDGLLATLEAEPAAPLFPLLVWLMHGGLSWLGAIEPADWGSCAQLVAASGLVLAVVPAYLMFRHSVSELAAATGGLFFCVVTVLARLGGDGLSDSTHLALVIGAMWLAASYLMSPRRVAWRLLASGILLGLALLTRTEAIVVVPALLLTMLIEAIRSAPAGRPALARGAGCLVLGLGIVLAPYFAVAGALRAGDTTESLLRRRGAVEQAPFNTAASDLDRTAEKQPFEKPQWHLPDGRLMAFGRKDTASSMRFRGLGPTLFEFIRELAQSLNYGIGLLCLFGLWSMRRSINRPIDRFLIALDLLYAAAALTMSATHGYLAGRHLLLIVVTGLPWGALGAWDLAERMARFAGRMTALSTTRTIVAGRALGGALVLAVALACLHTTLAPLHTSRWGHRQATNWLRGQTDRSAAVLDSAGYTALYSGLKTYRYRSAQAAFLDPQLAYVVVEAAEMAADSDRGATMRELLGRFAVPEASFAPPGAKHADRTVLIFRWRPERFAQFAGGAYAR